MVTTDVLSWVCPKGIYAAGYSIHNSTCILRLFDTEGPELSLQQKGCRHGLYTVGYGGRPRYHSRLH